jgi:purine-nucleoside phosphorylase
MEVAGISCVANLAAGLSPTPLSHAEVLAMVSAAAGKTVRLVRAFLARLAAAPAGA